MHGGKQQAAHCLAANRLSPLPNSISCPHALLSSSFPVCPPRHLFIPTEPPPPPGESAERGIHSRARACSPAANGALFPLKPHPRTNARRMALFFSPLLFTLFSFLPPPFFSLFDLSSLAISFCFSLLHAHLPRPSSARTPETPAVVFPQNTLSDSFSFSRGGALPSIGQLQLLARSPLRPLKKKRQPIERRRDPCPPQPLRPSFFPPVLSAPAPPCSFRPASCARSSSIFHPLILARMRG